MGWFGIHGLVWFGLVVLNFEKWQFLNIKQRLGLSLLKGPKVCGGVNGGSAGARISRPIIVIRLESKLINKTKVMCARVCLASAFLITFFGFGLVFMDWFGLVWLF